MPCFSPQPSPRAAKGSRASCPGPGRRLLSPQVYIEDSLGERIWVDSPHCKAFVDNIQTAFNTRMPPKSMLLQGEAGRSGGDLSAGERGGSGWEGTGFSGRRGLGSLPPGSLALGGQVLTAQVGARPMRPRSAGSSPHPSLTEEEDSQTELLIAEEKLSPEQEGQLMPR